MGKNNHILCRFFDADPEEHFTVFFNNGDVFSLKNLYILDYSIYEEPDGWSAEIVEMISDPENKFHKPGNGLDFYERDVFKVISSKGKTLNVNEINNA